MHKIATKSMIEKIKNNILRVLGLEKHLSSDYYIKYARSKGVSIGEGTQFFGTKKIDCSPLVSIGKNCKITDGVRMVHHTGDADLLERCYGSDKTPNVSLKGQINIGNNVFVGEQSIILPDTEIGDNCIIGAGSIVSNNIPPESVAAGNPCEVIMSLQEYRRKRVESESAMIDEIIRVYHNAGRYIDKSDIHNHIKNNTQFENPSEFLNR